MSFPVTINGVIKMELNDYLLPQVQSVLDHLYVEEVDGIEEIHDDGELYFQLYQKAAAMIALDVALKLLANVPGGTEDFYQELQRLWQHGPTDLHRSLAEAAFHDLDSKILPIRFDE